MTLDEAIQVATTAANDLGRGEQEADPHEMRVALVVLLVELHKAASTA